MLAKHPRVDPQRIVLMGFSRGGQAALYASLKRFHQLWNKSGVEFAGLHSVLSGLRHDASPATPTSPTSRSASSAARWTTTIRSRCARAYAERLKAAGRDVQVTEYPNASHSFDNPLGPTTATLSPQSQSVRNCKIVEEPAGVLINASTKEPFTYKDACVALGPHLGSRSGGDPAGQAGGDGVRADGLQDELSASWRTR